MTRTVAVLATLDTKGEEAQFLREQIEALGGKALLVDLGVLGKPAVQADLSREEVARAGGTTLDVLMKHPSREAAQPVMVAGATKLLLDKIKAGELHSSLGLGGLQGTAVCSQIMRALPYGFPKLIVSTVASGNTSAYVDIKDITMMFSVGDILGLNDFTRRILANAAGAAWGMGQVQVAVRVAKRTKPLIGMTNLGVLTQGAMHALELFAKHGYEVIVFHAVGTGGRAMEQMMKEGVIGAVFDYGLGEISDELFHGLRAGTPERLTVAGDLGLPQVLCPGGTEHLGFLVEPNTVPEAWRDHQYTFHSPVVLAPRLNAEEFVRVAKEIGKRLQHTKGKAVMMLPLDGTSRYGKADGLLRDPAGDQAFFAALKASLPKCIPVVERNTHAEDPAFVQESVERLIGLIEGK
jgi:uncharacterized protein (UPF0261 family)